MNIDRGQETHPPPAPSSGPGGPPGAREAPDGVGPLGVGGPPADGTGIQGLQPQDYIPLHLAAALYGAALLQSSITAWWRRWRRRSQRG
eukprot:3015265-Lingulodinium_polyedra.AAC.1